MITKKILLSIMILSTFGIISSSIGSASAPSLDVVTLSVLGDIGKFFKKTAGGVVCVTATIGSLGTGAADQDMLYHNKVCKDFP